MSLPLAAMERLLKKAGVERVSEEAKITLKEILESHANNVSQKAWEMAKHAKRKTLKSDDLKLASK
ncbi:NFYB/HAP3 family transcription factor subunit [Candidatus Woesearchaeota archaeon]|nr:NFYB/HAP3 family transcription factor subunit [Candidatus Woesearchaeota archaeon]